VEAATADASAGQVVGKDGAVSLEKLWMSPLRQQRAGDFFARPSQIAADMLDARASSSAH
jgi:hypothetical protein